ncbi:hypothetical protein AK812_SmicGene47694, partial [Symbiodinium microadriaticum]
MAIPKEPRIRYESVNRAVVADMYPGKVLAALQCPA